MTGYRIEDFDSIPDRGRDFSYHHIQTSCQAHQVLEALSLRAKSARWGA